MFFRVFVSSAFLLLIVWLFISCASEDQVYKPTPKIALSGIGGECLTSLDEQFQAYFAAELNQLQIQKLWGCVDEAIDLFTTFMQGQRAKDAYTAEEIRYFIEVLLLSNKSIDGELWSFIKDIKVLLLGGQKEVVTHAELSRLRHVVNEVSLVMQEANDSIPLFLNSFKDQKRVIDGARIDQAEVRLNQALLRLGNIFETQQVHFSSSELQRLVLRAGASLLSIEKQARLEKKLSEWLSLLLDAKYVFVDGDRLFFSKMTWRPLFQLAADIGYIYLRFDLFFDTTKWKDLSYLRQVSLIGERAAVIIDRGIHLSTQRKRQKDCEGSAPQICLSELRPLIDGLQKTVGLPLNLNADSAIHLLSTLLQKVFSPEGKATLLPATLDHLRLKRMKEEFDGWVGGQRLIVNWIAQTPKAEAVLSPQQHWLYRTAYMSPWPLVLDQYGRAKIGEPITHHNYDYWSLTRLNWEVLLIRNLMHAYASGSTTSRSSSPLSDQTFSLAQADASILYQDFKPLLVDLDLVDEDDQNFYERIFLEGNLFLPRSDRELNLSFDEAIEYLHYVVSGLNGSSRAKQELVQICPGQGSEIAYECFTGEWPELILSDYHHVPFFQQYVKGLSKEQKLALVKSLERSVRDESQWETPVGQGDLVEVNILLLYIETIFKRYDRDGSGALNVDESRQAYQVMEPTLKSLLPLDHLDVMFTFMLKYGRLPGDQAIDQIRFMHWQLNRHLWEFHASRGRLAEIIATLSRL